MDRTPTTATVAPTNARTKRLHRLETLADDLERIAHSLNATDPDAGAAMQAEAVAVHSLIAATRARRATATDGTAELDRLQDRLGTLYRNTTTTQARARHGGQLDALEWARGLDTVTVGGNRR